MLLGLVTLFSALLLSVIAAWYSVIGLTAIFAGAVIPVIIMGIALENAKVVATLWLHYNWERAEWKIKSYLVIAVGVLMLITSMGIFGLLSKSHADQAVPTGDIQAQVLIFDEKIKTQKDNIEANRKALAQMDVAVDQLMARTDSEQGAIKSANLRQSQKKERARLLADNNEAQKAITKLQEERAPSAAKLRQVVAEVGPVRYLAALIYGDKTDQNMLEAAVRWVIIIIVFVFDPLAIVMLLAAATSIDWSKLDRRKKIHDDFVAKVEETKEAAELAALQATPVVAPAPVIEPIPTPSEDEMLKLVDEAIAVTRGECAAEAERQMQAEFVKIAAEQAEEQRKAEESIAARDAEIARLNEDLEKAITMILSTPATVDESTFAGVSKIIADNEKTLLSDEGATVDERTLVDTGQANATADQLTLPSFPERHGIVLPPRRDIPEHFPKGGNANFGVTFPDSPLNGDLFLRVDYIPSKLFKWLGDKWVEVDKGITESFAYDKEYIKLLVDKVSSGEYDIDDLNQSEQDQIAQYLHEQETK